MLKTIVKAGSYHDSVTLMLLTNAVSSVEGVKKVSIMMATPANKDIFKQGGLETEELMAATPNDMVVVADVDDESVLDTLMAEVMNTSQRKVKISLQARAQRLLSLGTRHLHRCQMQTWQ